METTKGLAAPARRALSVAGYTSLEQLIGVTERELAALHGMEVIALRILDSALTERYLNLLR